MAGRIITGSTELTEVALVGATVKTVLEAVAAANHQILLLGWGVSFDGVSVTAEPVEVSLAVKSVAATASAVTERDRDEDKSGTIQTTFTVNASAEGTITYDMEPRNVHPQTGFEIWYPEGKEIVIIAAGILGIRCTAPVAVNVHAFMVISE